jgi:hypothetical protein
MSGSKATVWLVATTMFLSMGIVLYPFFGVCNLQGPLAVISEPS